MGASDFQPGDVIGRRYRLIERLGAGAMGVVWKARNEAIDRCFAIKLMRPDATANASRLQRFFREAKVAGRLRHRSIIEVYDLGHIEQIAGEPRDPHAGTPYLVMELLDGEPLDALLARVGRLPAGTALRLVETVARGLHVAHQRGIIHRDLKPANLFLHRDEGIVPKVLDFGVSKLLDKIDPGETTEGTILGSPAYMSPEQTWGEGDLDGRADVWSLGVVLYKLLCGALPFEGNNFHAIMMAINNSPARPLGTRVPELPPAVCALVHRCLEKDREARFSSASALADALDEVLATHALESIDLDALVTSQVPREGEVRTTLTARVGTNASISGTAKIVDADDPTVVSPPLFASSVQVVPAPIEAGGRPRARAALLASALAIAGLGAVFAIRSSPPPKSEEHAAATASVPSTVVASAPPSSSAVPAAAPSAIVPPSASSAPVASVKQQATKKPKLAEAPAHEGVLRAGF
ncbi:MAG: serine/threonine-protein kinase [Polyangiales bacterium]